MKVFISWSGPRSRAVAELFNDWLKCVIQASQPWISTRDIDRGAIWFSEINDKLKDVSVGIVCLTQENKDKPWILFETGALAKGLTTNRVCTFLIDLEPSDLHDPLAQFNHTTPNSSSVWELTRTINACLSEKALDERILRQVFDTYWPQFDGSFKQALSDNPPGVVIPPRSEQDILSEILSNTRTLTHKIRDLENEVYSSSKFKSKLLLESASLKEIISNEILKLINSGLTDESEIAMNLTPYGLPDNVIFSLIREHMVAFGIKKRPLKENK
ncbi:TIR domain-containing protein [Klebsiella pneumoniae]|uniref:TIR domain-containing protein n=1 Tax=Klebsiella pneumoniae complex TaxID=3390273 RepID=UPI000DE704AD|nr:TIR domain-containing protein [Klebsiella pneumoniae]HCI6649725.1 toll/interleukin-1 receptor domain-containing protein [Klebsiella variicola subsp. variicola]EKW9879530.1 toll/interleukin-1 receptor domain-containing protein [Klebsiella pneumoniae]ELA0365413.1 toll/interleukin-1 receptor domain-containing protein [Klebsiella pneumoniae]ELA0391929.1 toll/interleukin-1 receptor domain-containing protein [Klebsiella pneumoniae]EMC2811215.1 toll/interleukin-1 receptor domain-containing protein